MTAIDCIKAISFSFGCRLLKGFGFTNSGLVLHNKATLDNGYWLKYSGQGVKKRTKFSVPERDNSV